MLEIDKEWLKSPERRDAEMAWFKAAMACECGDGMHYPEFEHSPQIRNARLAFKNRVQPGKQKADH
jgi:hypothetical protein